MDLKENILRCTINPQSLIHCDDFNSLGGTEVDLRRFTSDFLSGWDFSDISLPGLGFGQNLGWEMGFEQNMGWEMGFIPPPPPGSD